MTRQAEFETRVKSTTTVTFTSTEVHCSSSHSAYYYYCLLSPPTSTMPNGKLVNTLLELLVWLDIVNKPKFL